MGIWDWDSGIAFIIVFKQLAIENMLYHKYG